MIDGGVVAVIPARGGSKRLPKKNILELAGKPLIAWTIEAALKSKSISDVIVSTEDIEIAKIARQFGAKVPYMRSDALATDYTKSIDVVLDLIRRINFSYKYIALLQPTSPLRTAIHIDESIEVLKKNDADAVVSVCKLDYPVEWSNVLPQNGAMDAFFDKNILNMRSQDFPNRYRLNGAIYIIKKNKVKKDGGFVLEKGTYAYLMDRQCSVDIDTKLDFTLANILMSN